MLNRIFGNYLVDKKIITIEQLNALLPVPKEIKAEVETIAVLNKVMTANLVVDILKDIDKTKTHFGEVAIESGYLTDEKLEQILGYQTNTFMKFIQMLLNNNLLELTQINALLDDFQQIKGFTDPQMSALIHDDLEQCVNIFVAFKSPHLKELTITLIQTLRRLIDKDVYLDKAYSTRSFRLDRYAYQALVGDLHIKFYLSAPDDGLLAIANYFTGDTYSSVNDDALDNVGEFINCINGLFATNLSYEDVSVDMNSPDYSMEGAFINNDALFVIPLYANGYSFSAVFEVY